MAGSDFEVLLGGRIVGSLNPDAASPFGFHFRYDRGWLQDGGLLLSPALPKTLRPLHSPAAAFFENMLPEGDAFDRLVQYAHVSRRSILGLLLAMQNDLPGAVRIRTSKTVKVQDTFRPISDDEIVMRLEAPTRYPMDIWDGRPRLSVAGMQTKLNVLKLDGVLGLAEGDQLCSDRILKFERTSSSHHVINEFLTMQLAQHAGLPVAQTKLCRISGHPVLEVLRFDRRVDQISGAPAVRRRHVIDGCQALGLFSAMKYERNLGDGRDVALIRDGVSIKKLLGLCTHVPREMREKFCLQILDWVIFCLIAGNTDAHGKNISFFVTQHGLSVTPWYDLVDVRLIEGVSHELAMSLGDEFSLKNIHALQLLWEADEAGIKKEMLAERLSTMLASLKVALDGIRSLFSLLLPQELEFAHDWHEDIEKSLRRWQNEALILPDLSL